MKEHSLFGGRIAALLCRPEVDRLIALVACIPFFLELWNRWASGTLEFTRVALGLNTLLQILTMLVRTPPQRVSPNPLYWLMAFVATYGMLFFSVIAVPGYPLVPAFLANSISILALLILLWSRISLGRNIGLIPAQRKIVTSGAYGWVRHPIYTGNFLSLFAVFLSSFAWVNAAFIAWILGIFVAKSFIEENFLKPDPDYASYLEKVRWRWIPGIF
jgi:protein-S-isoprenylcysteine O-methyltransferase Ste14